MNALTCGVMGCLLAMGFAGGIRAEDHPLPNPVILKWQFEAQERERFENYRRDLQIEHAQTERQSQTERRAEAEQTAAAQVVDGDRSENHTR